MKKVLNVGGHDRSIALPAPFAGYQQLLLDIDPAGKPDIVCDARRLDTLEAAHFDAIYCSHNLEHYHRHEVPQVLAGFLHVLKDGGFAYVRVPDLHQVMQAVVQRRLDIDSTLYPSPAGPISVHDVIFGWGQEIQRSGNDFFAHKTGFSPVTLNKALRQAGFTQVYTSADHFEIAALALKGALDPEVAAAFQLPAG